jgi:hypothetical protein
MTVQNYTNEAHRTTEQRLAEQKHQHSIQGWRQVIDEYPLQDCMANFRMLDDYCEHEITLGKFEFLLNNPPAGFSLLWQEEWQSLLQECLSLLRDNYGRRPTNFDLKNEEKRMRTWNRAKLRARRDQLREIERLRPKSADEIRKELAEKKEKERPYPGFPTMLSTTVPKYPIPGLSDGIRAIPTGEYIRWISKNDLFTFKRLCAVYSSEQVNFWLNS